MTALAELESPYVVSLFPSAETNEIDNLSSQIVSLAGRLASATCRWLLLVARFDQRDGCARFGMATTARWMSHYCGLSHRTSVEHVRVAKALATFPSLAEGMDAGRLSYSHVRAISRVVKPGDDELLADLICSAEYGSVGQLETLVRGYRRATSGGETEPTPQYLNHRWDDESRWKLNASLDAELGAVVRSALDTIMRTEELTAPQALARIAEIALAATAGGKPLPVLRGDERAAIVVHLDAAALGSDSDRPAAHIQDGPGLPIEVTRRLLCSGRIRPVLHDAQGSVLDVGRSQRLATKRQFFALLLRKRSCHHPGCESRHALEAHHIVHWLDGGRTDLRNLVLLCRRHHHALHDNDFSISTDRSGKPVFRLADGTPIPARVDPSSVVTQAAPLETEHAGTDPDAATTRWDGTPMDRLYAISCLAQTGVHVNAPGGDRPVQT